MDSFKSLYLEYCKTYNVEPQEVVKSEIKRLSLVDDETSYTFNLSSHHLSEKTCMILGKLLANDQRFTCLQFNDCALSHDSLREICNAMMSNNSVRILELKVNSHESIKGNNIHSEGTEHLAKMLRQNRSIKTLSLEWNSLGLMNLNSFPMFCESLGMNKTLKDLDLRNNQITHTSALELCVAIETNNTLESLDLRWNNIGLVGGKGILGALKKNFTINKLQITGNNIPDDIMEAINLKMTHNTEQIRAKTDYTSRTKILANQLQNVEHQRDKQVNLLLSKIDVQEEAVRRTNRTMSEKVKKLQVALEDRMSAMNSMASKLSIAEADLALADQKCSDLEHALQKIHLEKENETKLLTAKAKHDKEELLGEKLKLERELNDYNQRYAKLEEKNKELERKCQELQLSAYEAKEKLAQGSAEYQIKMAMLDEEARRLKQKHRDEIKDVEVAKQKELERVKEEASLTEKNLKERINKLENMKHSLEDDITRLKSDLANEKLAHEQELHELRVKAQLEDNLRRKELDDRVRLLQAAKDDLVMENNKMNAKMTDLQQKTASQTLEIETLKRNNDSLRNSLHEKELALLEDHEKLKTEYDKRIKSIQAEIDRCDEFKNKLNDQEIENKKLKAENQISGKNMQSEIDNLKMKVKNLEDILKRYREEDEIRNRKAQDMIKEVFKPSQILNNI